MLYRTLFPRDWFSELERLQRNLQQSYEFSPSIRGFARGGFPEMNIGSTPQSVEIYAFAPGLESESIELKIEKGVLTLAGERKAVPPPQSGKTTRHIDERFSGQFRRVVTLPDDIDPTAVHARYRDGVLHISIPKRAETKPRRIAIQ